MLEEYLKFALPQADVHLIGARIKAVFGGISERAIVELLTRLDNGAPARGMLLRAWEGRFAQFARAGTAGSVVLETLNFLLGGKRPLTGATLNTFWTDALGTTGGSDILLAIVRQLTSPQNGLNAQQIHELVMAFLHPTNPWIRLSKNELLSAITDLRAKLSPLQVRAFCNFLKDHNPQIKITPKVFLKICHDVHATASITSQRLSTTISLHGNLSARDLAIILSRGPFTYCIEFLNTALPPIVLPAGVANSPLSLLEHTTTFDTSQRVADVLTDAFAADVPLDVLARMLCHLNRIPNGGELGKLQQFINKATTFRAKNNITHTWQKIMDLVSRFVTDLRIANGPNTLATGANIVVPRLVCTGERIKYFLEAHCYRFFDFNLVDRTKADITFFPQGTNTAGMRGIVNAVFAAIQDGDISDARQSAETHIINVQPGGAGQIYEIGLIRHGIDGAALIHLMPFTVDPDQYWHKDLLSAIGKIF